jgi:hypothetical protein
LDVSNLTQVKAVGIAPLKTDAPFSFAMALGDSAELVCFPGRQAAAILDLHHLNSRDWSPLTACIMSRIRNPRKQWFFNCQWF